MIGHRAAAPYTALAMRTWMIVTLAAAALAWGCGKKDEAPAELDRYTVKGRVALMPDGEQSKKIDISHEAIPTFKTRSGKQNGMVAMRMPFAVGDGASLAGLTAGDPIEFTFVVDWSKDPALIVTEVKELPADTPLQLAD